MGMEDLAFRSICDQIILTRLRALNGKGKFIARTEAEKHTELFSKARRPHFSPVRFDAAPADQLHAFTGILVHFKLCAVGVREPDLPGAVATEFLWCKRDLRRAQLLNNRVDGFGFETEMGDPVIDNGPEIPVFENFDEISRSHLEVYPEIVPITGELERDRESQFGIILD